MLSAVFSLLRCRKNYLRLLVVELNVNTFDVVDVGIEHVQLGKDSVILLLGQIQHAQFIVHNLFPRGSKSLELLVDCSLNGGCIEEPCLLKLKDHQQPEQDREGFSARCLLAVCFPAAMDPLA